MVQGISKGMKDKKLLNLLQISYYIVEQSAVKEVEKFATIHQFW